MIQHRVSDEELGRADEHFRDFNEEDGGVTLSKLVRDLRDARAENERLTKVVEAATAYVDAREKSGLDKVIDAGEALSEAVHEYRKVSGGRGAGT